MRNKKTSRKKPRLTNDRVGRIAEMVAYLLLLLKGFRILKHRYKTKLGEIDMIAVRGSLLIFVEVKKRSDYLAAGCAIDTRNQKRIIRSANLFLAQNPSFQNHEMRFDAIILNHFFRPVHIKQAFYAE